MGCFRVGEKQKAAFKKIKAVVLQAILLTYPNHTRPFDVYPDAANKYAMGAMLLQDGNVVSTFLQKFNDARLKYMVTDQELLATAEVCKHFKLIIKGCEVRIHMDHKNLVYDKARHSSMRVLRTHCYSMRNLELNSSTLQERKIQEQMASAICPCSRKFQITQKSISLL